MIICSQNKGIFENYEIECLSGFALLSKAVEKILKCEYFNSCNGSSGMLERMCCFALSLRTVYIILMCAFLQESTL